MKIVIFGIGQLAEVLSVYIEQDSPHEIAGYTVDRVFMGDRTRFRGKPVAAWEEIEAQFPPGEVALLGPVSYRDNNRLRRARYLDGKRRGYAFASYIHSSAKIYTDQIGENSIVLEECTIQPFASVGACAILWSKVHIGHHARIGDYCFFASFCGIAGNTRIGEGTFFGGHSGAIDNLEIGAGCIIGSSAIVSCDMPDGSLAIERSTRIIPGAARRFGRSLLG